MTILKNTGKKTIEIQYDGLPVTFKAGESICLADDVGRYFASKNPAFVLRAEDKEDVKTGTGLGVK